MTYIRSLIFVLLLAPVARADDWPQWLGPKRDGTTSEKVAPWKDAPKEVWRVPVSKAYACPVVAEGRVFVHSVVPDKNAEELIAIDADTGKVAWRDVYTRAPYNNILGNGPRATPAVAGNRVYVCGITGVLSCYEADSGKRLWQVDMYKKLGAAMPKFGTCCSPLVVGNVVLMNVGGKGCSLVGFNTANGEVLWQNYDEPSSTSSPVLFAAAAQPGQLPNAVFMTTLRLLAVSPLDGSISWEYPLVFQPTNASTTPIVAGNRLIASTMTNGTTLLDIGLEDGKRAPKQAWQAKDMTGYFSTGVVDRDHVYLMTNVLQPKPMVTLRCVDLKTGKEAWHKDGIGYYHAGVIRTGDNHLLILDDSGTLRLLAADAKEYKEMASSKICGGTFSVPSLANGRLYVRDDKEVICFRFAP
jgi:outer membrane protein assembly factor BamB